MARLMFTEYLPDLPDFQNAGTTEATNVLPLGDSYQSMPSASVYSDALTARNQGAYSAQDKAGVPYTFAGDVSKLYSLSSAAYSDVSKGGGYSTGEEEWWRFAKYGNQVIATNYSDDMQLLTLGGANFADLSATAPKAKDVAVVKNFLVAINTDDVTDGAVPNRVRWPSLTDITAWTVSSVTQADFQDLEGDGGWNQRIIGGEYGVIFQERSIWRMTYVGSPIVFQFDEVERGRGTPAPGSVVKVGTWIAYLGIDGFYIFDGQRSVPIGANKVDKTFWDTVDVNYHYRMNAVADPDNQLIYWGYVSTNATNGRIDTILVYNYSPNSKMRWSRITDVDVQSLFPSLSEGYTLEQLDSINSSVDALTFSLDSRAWMGNARQISGFNSDNKQINYDGAAMDATIETTEAQIFENFRAQVTLVRPLVDGSSATVSVQLGERNLLSDSVSYQTEVSTNATGNCPVRSNARYHRARVKISGGFNHAQGIDIINATKAGMR